MAWLKFILAMAAGWLISGAFAPLLVDDSAAVMTEGLAAAWPDEDAVTVLRSPDGLFRVAASVDGHAFNMIVDTGATTSVIGDQTAARLGIALHSDGLDKSMQTLAGPARFSQARLARLQVSGVVMEQLEVAVMPTSADASVLGQDAIARLGHVTLSGNRLTIR